MQGTFFAYYGSVLRSVSLLSMEAPQVSVFAYYMRAPRSCRALSSLTMGASSDQFLRILYGEPLRSVSSHTIYGGPLRSVSALTIYGAPSDQFLRILYGATSDQFLLVQYEGHCQIMPPPPSDLFLRFLYGAPLRLVSSLNICGPPQICFFAYYMGADQFRILTYYYFQNSSVNISG